MFFWHAAPLGVRVAALHCALGTALSIPMIEKLFLAYRRVPFVSGYVPSVELKSQGIAYVAGVLCLCFALAWIERLALGSTAGYLALVAVIVGVSAAVMTIDHAWIRLPVVLDLDEAAPLPTQRLDLAG